VVGDGGGAEIVQDQVDGGLRLPSFDLDRGALLRYPERRRPVLEEQGRPASVAEGLALRAAADGSLGLVKVDRLRDLEDENQVDLWHSVTTPSRFTHAHQPTLRAQLNRRAQ
jgi:hypothetical protein